MKKTHFILFVLIVLLVFPTMVSAKANKSYIPLGTSLYPHEYGNVPFQMYGANLSVWWTEDTTGPYAIPQLTNTYPFPENRDYRATAVHFLQNAAWAVDFPDGTTLGQVTVCYRDDTCEDPLDLTIGVNTEEWACDRLDNIGNLGHTNIKPAWSQWDADVREIPFLAHAYYASVQTDPGKILDYIQLDLVTEEGVTAGVNIARSSLR